MMKNEEMAQTILEEGPLSPAEIAEMSYPVRVAYLALMLSWVMKYGLERMIAEKEQLKPMVLGGLQEVGAFIEDYWKGQATSGDGSEEPEGEQEQVRAKEA